MLDDELTALWHKDVQRERNPAFELAVMRRMERVFFWRAAGLNLANVAALTLLLVFCAPILTATWLQTFAPFVSAPVMALLLMVFSYALSKLPANTIRMNGRATEE